MSDDDRQRPPNFQNLQSLVLPPVPRASNHNGSATSNITHADLSRRQLSTTTRGQHSSEPYPKSSNKGGVRGRVTVVCAECKRLKLRCSRERPQSTLHANTGNGSRDLSPYALRVSSPPPPGSSHSSTSTATDNILSRIASAESQLSNYMRTTQSHNFSHGHSLSHGSATSMASASGAGGGGSGGGVNGPGLGGQSFGSSTLTPITPSHPSSLHHYVVSGSGGGHSHSHSHSHSGHHHSYSQTDPLHHSHHHQQQPQQQQPHHHHQRSSSRHSPPQHPNSAHLQPLESSSYSPDGRQETHRPRQLSMSNSSVHLPRHQSSNMTPTTSPGSYGFSSRETMTKPLKIPTPPGSGSSPALPSQQSAGASSQQGGTKLPEISNILTLLSPAPISSSTNESKSPHAFPTPVSGVVSSSHSILNIGVGPNIQHTQSDVRGSTNTSTSSVRHGHQGSNSSRRGSADYNARPSSREDVPSASTSPPLHRSASASRPNSSDAPQQPHHKLHHKRSNSPLPSSHPIGSTGSLYPPPGQQHRRENSGPMDAEYEKDRGVYQQQLQQQREQMQAAEKSHPANRLARPHSRREEEEEDDDDEMEVEVDEIDD
ncbi:hypothetical protein CPB86DRAFT_66271 [Serendipita vermifera]|nr:hypothetical protein CPB86DRAFT_66271 [Serendipita vermifera]